MSATTNGGESTQLTEIGGHEWVSDLLREVADADGGRPRIAATLAAEDLRRIWHWTEYRATLRDRRTHHIIQRELERRGLLDPAGGLATGLAPDAA